VEGIKFKRGVMTMNQNKKTFFTRIRHILSCTGLALFLVGTATPSNLSYAQGRVKPEIVLPKHYPNGFDGYGLLQRIGHREVVIDDQLLKLSPNIEYHTPTRMNASGAYFRPGVLVGFLRNSENEIVSLWLIE
jgi:hypothetical protein